MLRASSEARIEGEVAALVLDRSKHGFSELAIERSASIADFAVASVNAVGDQVFGEIEYAHVWWVGSNGVDRHATS